MDIGGLLSPGAEFQHRLGEAKKSAEPRNGWYPYGSLSNLWHLDRLLTGDHRDLHRLGGAGPVADIGAADGDMAYFLASVGMSVEIIDNGPTNYNGLEGARLLGQLLGIPAPIREVDLDRQFELPRDDYSLVLFLGLLYHLQNPYYAMRQLASHTRFLLLSTRVAAQTVDGLAFGDAPIAYLVDPRETNNDPTNYWIFSRAGLFRLASRAGWEVLDEMTVGHTDGTSDPSSQDRDERAFLLLRSTR